MDRYIEVRTQIPERLLPRYHEVIADLLREQPASDAQSITPQTDRDGMPRFWTEPEIKRTVLVEPRADGEGKVVVAPPFESVPSSSSDAFNLYLQLSPRALELFHHLVSQPGHWVPGNELAELLGASPAELTGSLSSIRKRCDAMNRPMPLRYRPGPNGGAYSIDPNIADVFRKAHDDLKWGGPDEEGAEVLTEMIENTWSLLDVTPQLQFCRYSLQTLDRLNGDEQRRKEIGLQLDAHEHGGNRQMLREQRREEIRLQLDALTEKYGQLVKRRAFLLRKYDPRSVEDFGLGEKALAEQLEARARSEVSMTETE